MSAPRLRRPPARGSRAEAGTAVVGTSVGVVVFLAFLLAAVQLLTSLYATSTTDAVAADAVRSVASRTVDHSDPTAVAEAERRAEEQAEASLGRSARHVEWSWSVTDGIVRLRYRLTTGGLHLPGLPAVGAFSSVDRSVTARVEGP